jgi:hypothetical protein
MRQRVHAAVQIAVISENENFVAVGHGQGKIQGERGGPSKLLGASDITASEVNVAEKHKYC